MIGVSYGLWVGTGQIEVDVVERFHFVEYGLVAFMFYRVWRTAGDVSVLVLPMLAGVTVGVMDEWFQWFIPNRVGELHDVALNLVAVGCGLMFTVGAEPPEAFGARLSPGSARRMATGLLVALASIGFFVMQVHVGHEVTRGDATFRSRYTAGELDALSRDRAARWKTNPPLTFKRLSREDQYMDEALWHIRARNQAWDASDFRAAWSENQILEEFFGPVLDTPSYVSPGGHRWSPEQRVDAGKRAAADRGPYYSHAEPRQIFVWAGSTGSSGSSGSTGSNP